MQHLNTLSQIVGAASSVVELARSSHTYVFNVGGSPSCYVHVRGGEVRIARHTTPQIEIVTSIQAPFAWRVAAEQDEAGVYLVALRRPVLGGVGGASFLIRVPEHAHLALRLEHSRLSLEDVNGLIELPPRSANMQIVPRLPERTS